MHISFLLLVFLQIWISVTGDSIQKRIKLTRKGFYPHWYRVSSQPGGFQDHAEDRSDKRPSSFVRNTTKSPEVLEGWLPNPKKPLKIEKKIETAEIPSEIESTSKGGKKGFCGVASEYGIRCGRPMNQCGTDDQCPGVSKCCLVSDCGLLCVKPESSPPDMLAVAAEQNNEITTDEEEIVTTSEGLKLADIKVEDESSDLQAEGVLIKTADEVRKHVEVTDIKNDILNEEEKEINSSKYSKSEETVIDVIGATKLDDLTSVDTKLDTSKVDTKSDVIKGNTIKTDTPKSRITETTDTKSDSTKFDSDTQVSGSENTEIQVKKSKPTNGNIKSSGVEVSKTRDNPTTGTKSHQIPVIKTQTSGTKNPENPQQRKLAGNVAGSEKVRENPAVQLTEENAEGGNSGDTKEGKEHLKKLKEIVESGQNILANIESSIEGNALTDPNN